MRRRGRIIASHAGINLRAVNERAGGDMKTRKKMTRLEILKRAAEIAQWALDVCPSPPRGKVTELKEIIRGLKRMAI